MKLPNRDLLVLLKNGQLSEADIALEVEFLNLMLILSESPGQFCRVHELVDRNIITRKHHKIMEAVKHEELKPFRFLLCKN